MNLFHFSCDCRATPEHLAEKMIAEVFVLEPTLAEAETRLRRHLESTGWVMKELLHCDLVRELPVHDSRLRALMVAARQNQIAAEFSVY